MRLRSVLTLALFVLVALPASAQAHGGTNPVASSYLARVRSVPAGLQAKVVDGDLRVWMRVPVDRAVVVLDYNHVPYLRFTAAGVAVNRNSVMYYYNLVPPSVPPASVTRAAPRWVHVTGAHSYLWHDGRLQDLSAQQLLPGQRYVGVWRIPLLVGGHAAALSGGVWFRPAPSLVWFWPIAVIVLCALAAWRVGSEGVDRMLLRLLALGVLGASIVGAGSHWLHGRPGIAVGGLLETLAVALFVAWAARRVIRDRAGGWTLLAIIIVGLWVGITLLPTLWHGYTLLAVPPFVGRAATVICLSGSLGLLPLLARISDPLGRRATETGEAVVARR
ncbi:MAG TPA: hypothetical protein VGI55_17945 [Solirubrobacteraceae bacterium]